MESLSAAETQIVLQAYAAITEPSRWSSVLAAIAAQCDASIASLGTVANPSDDLYLRFDHNVDPATLREYAAHWSEQDAWVGAASRRGVYRSGQVHIGSDVLSWEDLESTAFYNELAARAGLKAMASCILHGAEAAGQPMTHLSVFRSPGQPEFQRDDARMLARLRPHLTRAVECARAVSAR